VETKSRQQSVSHPSKTHILQPWPRREVGRIRGIWGRRRLAEPMQPMHAHVAHAQRAPVGICCLALVARP
jgi:hypothetical protein